MKITSLISSIYLIVIGLNFSIAGLSGFNPLLWLTFYQTAIYRSFLAVAGVCALWMIFWLIAFRPFKNLN